MSWLARPSTSSPYRHASLLLRTRGADAYVHPRVITSNSCAQHHPFARAPLFRVGARDWFGVLRTRRLWHVSEEAQNPSSENVTTHVAACVAVDRTSGGTIFCLATRIRPHVWLVFGLRESEGYRALRVVSRLFTHDTSESTVGVDPVLGFAYGNHTHNTIGHWVVSTRSITRWSGGGLLRS